MIHRSTMLLGLLGLLAACTPQWDVGGDVLDDNGDVVDDTDDGIEDLSIGDQPEVEPTIFNQDFIHTIDIELGDGSEDALWEDPYEYAPATVTIDDGRLEHVGGRLRRQSGGVRHADGQPKGKRALPACLP